MLTVVFYARSLATSLIPESDLSELGDRYNVASPGPFVPQSSDMLTFLPHLMLKSPWCGRMEKLTNTDESTSVDSLKSIL